jgi:hypothetical protein
MNSPPVDFASSSVHTPGVPSLEAVNILSLCPYLLSGWAQRSGGMCWNNLQLVALRSPCCYCRNSESVFSILAKNTIIKELTQRASYLRLFLTSPIKPQGKLNSSSTFPTISTSSLLSVNIIIAHNEPHSTTPDLQLASDSSSHFNLYSESPFAVAHSSLQLPSASQ